MFRYILPAHSEQMKILRAVCNIRILILVFDYSYAIWQVNIRYETHLYIILYLTNEYGGEDQDCINNKNCMRVLGFKICSLVYTTKLLLDLKFTVGLVKGKRENIVSGAWTKS